MKKMIITQEQFRAINEAALNAVTYDSSTGPDAFRKALTTVQSNITEPIALTDINSDPGINNGTSTIPGGVEAAKKSTTSSPKTRTTIITPNSPMSESRTYSKRVVELGRMLEMRKRGKVFSKKQLNEMFMETQDNANRLRAGMGSCQISDIFDAVEEVFPEELDGLKNAFFNGADIEEYICSIFSKEGIDSEREEEFLDILGI